MKSIEVVAAVIIHNKQILCMQRGANKHAYLAFKYEFPGGKIEAGELRSEALARELREEMDLDLPITEDDYFMTVDYQYPDFHIVMHAFICKVEKKDFVMKEHNDHKWLEINDLFTIQWAPADVPIANKLIEKSNEILP